MAQRDFASAKIALESTISVGQKLATVAARRQDTVRHMQHYATLCGLDSPMRRMSFVHVAGSKGKGSTCVFVDALLRHHLRPVKQKIGLYTSPHLVSVVERIRIDGKPITEAAFADAFWTVWDCLHAAEVNEEIPQIPGYFKFLTLVALQAWENAAVDVGVVEVGMGGRFDATNVLPAASVLACGITTLELEHTRVLGDTLTKIAWEKGGILRKVPGVSGPLWFTIPQNREAMQSLEACAEEQGSPIGTVTPLPAAKVRELCLTGDEVATGCNAALALTISRAVMKHWQSETSPKCKIQKTDDTALVPTESEVTALRDVNWPGRSQQLRHPHHSAVNFCIDGAHTSASMAACVRWYDSVWENHKRADSEKSVLLFACSHEKSPVSLLQALLDKGHSRFSLAIFCLPDSMRPSNESIPTAAELLGDRASESKAVTITDLTSKTETDVHGLASWPRTLAAVYASLLCEGQLQQEQHVDKTQVVAVATVKDAFEYLDKQPKLVLATGSLYLVGSVLEKLGWNPTTEA